MNRLSLALRVLSGRATSRAPVRTHARAIRAGYHAAQTTGQNFRTWRWADDLGPRSSHDPATRKILRERARLVHANSPVASGIVRRLAEAEVGAYGPRLQLGLEDRGVNELVEKAWQEWSLAVAYPELLVTARSSQAVDGEVFGVPLANPAMPYGLDFNLLEADRIEGALGAVDLDEADGIRHDRFGRPTAYRVLREHPGDGLNPDPDGEWVAASKVCHLFRPTRPGQTRGVTEMAPSLERFAQIDRYDMAVLAAAEGAASQWFVLQSRSPSVLPDGSSQIGVDDDEGAEAASDFDPFEPVDLIRNEGMILPDGYEAKAFDPVHPTTNHVEYVQFLIVQAAQPWNMPRAVALGDASVYNFASARVDDQKWDRTVHTDRTRLDRRFSDRLLFALLQKLNLLEDLGDELPAMLSEGRLPPRAWIWEGRTHIDPLKQALADTESLANGTATYAAIAARDGDDWDDRIAQRVREEARLRELEEEYGVSLRRPEHVAADTADRMTREEGTDARKAKEPARA